MIKEGDYLSIYSEGVIMIGYVFDIRIFFWRNFYFEVLGYFSHLSYVKLWFEWKVFDSGLQTDAEFKSQYRFECLHRFRIHFNTVHDYPEFCSPLIFCPTVWRTSLARIPSSPYKRNTHGQLGYNGFTKHDLSFYRLAVKHLMSLEDRIRELTLIT